VVINKRIKETKEANEDPIFEPPFPEVGPLVFLRQT
jgi:hypothetical protein